LILTSNHKPETLIVEKSTGDENCDTNAEMCDAQQNWSSLSVYKGPKSEIVVSKRE
jgi:hypothetical protein